MICQYKKSDSIVGFTKWYEDNYRVEGINWEEFDYCYPALGMYKEVEWLSLQFLT